MIEAFAPGRVNLMGDHTDHQGGLVLPIAIDLGTAIVGERRGDLVRLRSLDEEGTVEIRLGGASTPGRGPDRGRYAGPEWGRYIAALVELVRPAEGFVGTISTRLPVGRGLSSSAALEVSVALALGFEGSPIDLARLCQRSEYLAVGVRCGIMDQLASAAGVADHALLIDCHDMSVSPVPIPESVDVLVVDSGERRSLTETAYNDRLVECARAAESVGPLRLRPDLSGIADPVARRRARHVVSEIGRVSAFARALREGDNEAAGALMIESHVSLSTDFEVSTPRLDTMVQELLATPGIYGARLTGAGFGGSVVALAARGTPLPGGAMRVRASAGGHAGRRGGKS